MAVCRNCGLSVQDCPACGEPITWPSSAYWFGKNTVPDGGTVTCPACRGRFEVWYDGDWDQLGGQWQDCTALHPVKQGTA